MKKKLGLLLLFLGLSSSIVWAENLKDILKALEKKQSKWQGVVNSLKIVSETTTTLGGTKVVMRGVVYQKGNKIRSENEPIESSSDIPKEYLQKTVSIFDGKDLWVITSTGTQRIPMALGDVEKLKPIDDLGWLKKYENDIKLDGEEVVDGKPCYVIKVSNPVKIVLYLDKTSLEWVKSEQEVNGDKLVIKRRDFRPLLKGKDLMVPYEIEMLMNGEKVAETKVKEVEVNPSLPDSLFEVKVNAPTSSQKSDVKKEKVRTKKGWDKLEELAK